MLQGPQRRAPKAQTLNPKPALNPKKVQPSPKPQISNPTPKNELNLHNLLLSPSFRAQPVAQARSLSKRQTVENKVLLAAGRDFLFSAKDVQFRV